MRVRSIALILTLAATSACASTRQMSCAPGTPAEPPHNFGQVHSPDGTPTKIYRGGQPESCSELEYLKSIGVRSILKLNDAGLPIDASEIENAKLLGLTMRSIPFNARVIGRPLTCDSVRTALAFMSDPQNWPVFVHCTAGKDRTGYMIGLYEKLALHASTTFVLDELHRYGHDGVRELTMSQIDRELALDVPTCAPPGR
jgi:protein tyrosine/serine phosphatase